MLNRIYTIKQLNIIKELIKENTISSLRISILLLDNVVEILMYRYIKVFLLNKPYVKNNVKKMPYTFKNKVDLIVKNNTIEKPIGEFIKFFHKYRNNNQHHDLIRSETINPLVRILFNLSCDLFSKLESYTFLIPDEDDGDFKWLCKRYNTTLNQLTNDKNAFTEIVMSINQEIAVTNLEVKKCLYDHLKNRLLDLEQLIKYITEENKEITIKQINTNKNIRSIYKFDLRIFKNETQKKMKAILSAKNKIDATNIFMIIEQEIEKVENLVYPEVRNLDLYLDTLMQAWKERDL